MALTKTQISELYVSIFNRASEKSGSQNWLNSGYNTDATTMANAMLDTPAAKEYFGTSLDSNAAFVEHIYASTLNKGGATVDAAGKAGWVEFLETGASKGEMIAKMIEAIKEYQVGGAKYATADQATKDAAQQFENRVAVSDYTAETLETIAVSDIDSTLSFGGALNVTKDPATIATAKAAVDAANPASVGETFTLTAGVNVIEGTDKNDLIEGTSSSLSATRTLDALDQIDGGAGIDTANIALEGSFSGFTKDKGFMKNVEKVNLTNDSTIARDFNGQGVSGVTDYNLKGAVNLSSLKAISNVNAEARTEDLTIGYTTKAVEGTKDKLTLGVKDFGTVEDESTTAIEEKAVKVTAAGIEAVDLKVAGTNVLNLSGLTDAKDITLSGNGDTKINDLSAAAKTFDASAATAKIDFTTGATVAANAITKIATGSGDDKITVDTAKIAANAKISGGEGDDTLVLTGATATLQLNQTGIETVQLKNTGALTLSMKNTAGVENIVVNGATAASTLSNVGSGDINVALQGALTSAGALTSDHSGTTTINVTKPAATATVAAPIANAANVTLSKSTSLELNVAEKMNYTGTVTAAEASSVKVAATGALGTGAKIIAAKATSVEISNVDAVSTLDLATNKAVNLNISNAKNLTLATTSTLGAVESLTSTGAGDLTATNIALSALNSANISNLGNVTLGNTGSATQTYATTVNVEGAKGFQIGAMKTNNANITLNATSVVGAINNTGAIDAGTANVSVLAAATGTLTLGAITGKNVTVDASGILGTTTYDTITADNLTFKGSELQDNDLDGTGGGAVTLTGTANSVSLTGGLNNDTFKFTAATSKSIVVTGDLGSGNDSIDITASVATGATINISGLADYDTATITAAGTGLNTITGGTGADTIISNGATADVLTGGAGADKFVVGVATAALTAAGAKTITDFEKGVDKVIFASVTAGAVAVPTVTKGSVAVADFTAALAAANTALNSTGGTTKEVNAQQVGNDTYVFFNDGSAAGADSVVKLTGVALADVDAADFLA